MHDMDTGVRRLRLLGPVNVLKMVRCVLWCGCSKAKAFRLSSDAASCCFLAGRRLGSGRRGEPERR
jgi:hypothetical protein